MRANQRLGFIGPRVISKATLMILKSADYTGPAGPTGPTGPSGGAGLLPMINANAGTLVVGTPVYVSAAGHVDKTFAGSGSINSALCLGLVADVAGIAPGATGNIQLAGALTLTTAQWDAVTGLVGGLNANVRLWLDPINVGRLVAAAPAATGNVQTVVGRAASATILDINIAEPIGPMP